METKVAQLPAKSLPTLFVQEIAKKEPNTIPSRYVRLDEDPLVPATNDTSPPPQVPVIDMLKLISQESSDSELEKFHNACKDWGFFQLINHGVSLTLVQKMKSEVEGFFNLPLDEKKNYLQKEGDLEGFGHAFVLDEKHKLDWGDLFLVKTHPVHARNLFPNLPHSLRATLETYSTETKNLAEKILHLIAKALKIESDYMKQLFDEGIQSIRFNYYPPCPTPEHVIGLRPHTDASGLTILFQNDETDGLQIKKDGKWVPIKFLPNSFVVNLGDILEVATNGVYQSIEHRATINSVKERLTVATFYSPSFETELGPDPSLVTPENPAMFKRMSFGDYIKGYLSRELAGKSYIDTIRITK